MKYLSILLILALVACHKQSDVAPPVFTATIDGQSWTSSSTFCNVIGSAILIEGFDHGGGVLNFSVGDTVAGDYILEPGTLSTAWYQNSVTHTPVFATSLNRDTTGIGGKITITEINSTKKVISGNFSFQLYNDSTRSVINVTRGVFKDLPLTY